MAVFRVEKTKDFTIMSNHHLRNTELSLKAKGLLSLMLSLPEDWDYTTKGLAHICKDGVDSITTALKELERHGDLTTQRADLGDGAEPGAPAEAIGGAAGVDQAQEVVAVEVREGVGRGRARDRRGAGDLVRVPVAVRLATQHDEHLEVLEAAHTDIGELSHGLRDAVRHASSS